MITRSSSPRQSCSLASKLVIIGVLSALGGYLYYVTFSDVARDLYLLKQYERQRFYIPSPASAPVRT